MVRGMRTQAHFFIFLLAGLSLLTVVSAQTDGEPGCMTEGDSFHDRTGCYDGDGDGWSDPDDVWGIEDGADAFPSDPNEHYDLDGDGVGDNGDPDRDGDGANNNVDVWPDDGKIWSDTDGDGYADQGQHRLTDNCPNVYGLSRIRLQGCSDIDGDFVPDQYDDDADGDGIRNEMERAASSGTILYDPYNPTSVPRDSDQDTIPDVLDLDNDNDGWPDDIEIDRGSDPFDVLETPFNMYFSTNLGIFYTGGLNAESFTFQYNPDHLELSISAILDTVFEELLIPFLLIPIYLGFFLGQRNEYQQLLDKIERASSLRELREIEQESNKKLQSRKIRLYHGLVLRNAIEAAEGAFGGEEREAE